MSAEYDEFTQFDWFAEGKKREAKGEYEEAIKAYEEAIKIDPQMAKAWFYKSVLHYRLNQMDEALEAAKKALEFKPDWEKHFKKDMPKLNL